MFLGIDIGNTHIVWGFTHDGKSWTTFRTNTIKQATTDELGLILRSLQDTNGSKITSIAISSVVPQLNQAIQGAVEKQLQKTPVFFDASNIPITNLYSTPSAVGADRLVNAFAVKALYTVPAIIVDLGTATTFCVLSQKGEYLGGAIAPGIGVSAEALFQRASRLSAVRLAIPGTVIGRETSGSLNSGLVLGHCTMIEGMLQRMEQELGEKVTVIMTGGWGNLVKDAIPRVDIFDPELTLKGLWLLAMGNK